MILVPLSNPRFATVPAARSCELRVRGASALKHDPPANASSRGRPPPRASPIEAKLPWPTCDATFARFRTMLRCPRGENVVIGVFILTRNLAALRGDTL